MRNLNVCVMMAWASVIAVWTGPAAAQAKPNLLFIFADDQTFNSIRSLGNQEIQTPNLDRLVRQGMTFTHCYNQGGWGGAVCVASRTMLVTGKYLWHAFRDYKDTDKLYREENRLWPQLLERQGYDTYFSGKWHIRADAAKAFRTVRHIRPGMPRDVPQGYHRPIQGQPDEWKPWKREFGGFWEGGKHWSEVLADDAIDYIQAARQREHPFFMYLAFNAPHDPRQSPKEYVDRYPLSSVAVPANFLPEYPFQIGSNRLRDEQLAPFPRTDFAVKVNRQEYYAIITHMDTQIGRILNSLRQSGMWDNTYIIFTADHGLSVGQHGLMGKQNMFDHSVRVPFVAVGPDVPAGTSNSKPIYLQDIMPTTLELAGAAVPDHVQFQSRLELMTGQQDSAASTGLGEDAVYGAYMQFQRMVSVGSKKLLLYPQLRHALLFDLESDPLEMNDVSNVESNRPLMRKLFRRLLELQRETGDELDLRTIYPGLAS